MHSVIDFIIDIKSIKLKGFRMVNEAIFSLIKFGVITENDDGGIELNGFELDVQSNDENIPDYIAAMALLEICIGRLKTQLDNLKERKDAGLEGTFENVELLHNKSIH